MTLRQLRKERNMTQAQVAKAAGITQTTISQYESGDRKPNAINMMRLANVFGVSADYIFSLFNIS